MKRLSLLRFGLISAVVTGALVVASCAPSNGNPTSIPNPTTAPSTTVPPGGATPAVGAVGAGGTKSSGGSSATLVFPSATVTQTSDLKFTGSGFGPSETVIVSAARDANGATSEIGRVTTDAEGNIAESTIHPPDWLTSGAHALTAVGELSHRQFDTTLYVRAPKPFIQMNDYAVRQLDKVGFVAGGFDPSERVKVYLEERPQEPLATLDADPAGNLPWTELTLPTAEGGMHNLILQGQTSGLQISRQISVVTFTPQFDLDPYAGLPGTQTTLYGKGFAAGETIDVFVGASNQPAFTIQADPGGGFAKAGTIVVPANIGASAMDVTLVGESSGARVTRTFKVVSPYPYGDLSAFSGPPGSSIFFSGLGFAIGEKVNIYQGDRSGTLVATAQADNDGKFQNAGPVQVPATASSDVTYTFVGANSGVQSSAVFRVILPPSVGGVGQGPR